MAANRDYQYNFSEGRQTTSFNAANRTRKADTMLTVIKDACGDVSGYVALDIGASTGFIDHYLAPHFAHLTGIDIDDQAIKHAADNFKLENLTFRVADGMNTGFDDSSVDLVICNHIYEHVPSDHALLAEIMRILKPGGHCYFGAGNRFQIMEPHYRLPLLSVIPKPLGHVYIRLAGKASSYYENHRTFWQLRSLTSNFERHDYTPRLINEPETFKTDYMLRPGSLKQAVAKFIVEHLYWLVPTYIWILKKPKTSV